MDESGAAIEEFSCAVPERVEDDRRVEQDPHGLLESVKSAVAWGKARATAQGVAIKAAGLAVQRSGVLAWNATDGRVRHPMMTWADTRTAPIIQNFGRGTERISKQTGLPTIPHFAAGKIHMLQRQFLEPSVYVATLDAFLIHRLSGKKVFTTEDTMAARTMLYGLSERGWSSELCKEFQVDKTRLPMIAPSLAHHTDYEGIPFVALLGDQQAALIGRASSHRRPLLNLGTIASLTKDTGFSPVQKTGLMTSVLLSRFVPQGFTRELKFLVETTSPVTGAVLREPVGRAWCSTVQELNDMCAHSLADAPEGRAIAYFVNHRAASPAASGSLPNVMVCREGATIADRARAVVENVGNILVRMIEEFADKKLLGETFPAELDVAGGGSELDYLLQYVADVSGHVLHRLAGHEAGARGAALCAWMHSTQEFDATKVQNSNVERVYRCENPDRHKRYQRWLKLEQDVVRGALPPQAEVEP